MTPTLWTGSSTANACQSRSYSPARRISSSTIASASRSTASRSAVTSPSTRTASPGPGKGVVEGMGVGTGGARPGAPPPPQEAVVHEDAGEPLADRLVDQRRRDRRVDAAREPADHAVLVAHLRPDVGDGLVHEGAH